MAPATGPGAGQPRTLAAAHLACMASMLVWAAGLPAADWVIGRLPPLQLTAARLWLACALLLPLWLAVEGRAALARVAWRRAALVGSVGFVGGAVCLVMAQARTDAVTVAIISATIPAVGVGMEVISGTRRASLRLILGLVLSLAGGIAAYAVRLADFGLGLGAVFAFGSVLAFTWTSRETVRAFPELTALGRTAATLTGAALVGTLAAGVEAALAGPPDWARLGWPQLAALIVFGTGAIGVSQLLWIVSVGRLGIGLASLHGNATPFYVMLLAWALGSAWAWPQAAGAVLVVAGVLVATHAPRPDARRARP